MQASPDEEQPGGVGVGERYQDIDPQRSEREKRSRIRQGFTADGA